MTNHHGTSVSNEAGSRPPTIDSEIIAEVSWTVGNRPPEVMLSFQALAEPQGLFNDLHALGWTIPKMPPRPANAIDWTPDPVAGTDYTVLPWRVTEFCLEEGPWVVPSEDVGPNTLTALRNHGATIVGTSDQITEHAAAYAALTQTAPSPIAASPTAAQSAPVDPTTHEPDVQAPATADYRIIVLLGFAAEADPLPGHGTWVGVTGRKQVQCSWNEQAVLTDQPIPGHSDMGAHVANGAAAWYADTGVPLHETAPDGYRIVRLVLPDMAIGDAKVRRLNKVLGDDLQTFELRPLTNAGTGAVLVNATVGANSFEMLKSNLCLRMPTAVVRVQS